MQPPAIDDLLRRVGQLQASDLSLDPQDDGSALVMARIEGVRQQVATIPAPAVAANVARLKALANLPSYITDAVQDGRIDGRPFGIPGDLRLAVLPTVRGQRAAVRLPAIGALPKPDGLGLPVELTATLRAWLDTSDGLILVCGPTGSGKTTTIHSLLADLAQRRADRQIVTLEDPVERRLPGIIQTEIRPHLEFTFQDGLAAALRQDADVLVVGEIRDPATAAACVRAALTGHLVISTVHCARAADAVPRLLEMGVAEELLLPALRGVLAQRLVRLTHAACGGAGCAQCHGGYRGRQVVADVISVDGPARAAWRSGAAPVLQWNLDHQAAALVQAQRTPATEIQRAIG